MTRSSSYAGSETGTWATPEPMDRRGRTHLYRREDLDRLAQRAR